jgi:hypothetical protein
MAVGGWFLYDSLLVVGYLGFIFGKNMYEMSEILYDSMVL